MSPDGEVRWRYACKAQGVLPVWTIETWREYGHRLKFHAPDRPPPSSVSGAGDNVTNAYVAPAGARKILIVDDEAPIRELLRLHL